MLSANKEQISSFLEGSLQFHIPFFQRPYVWKIENWQEFFDSILEQLNKGEARHALCRNIFYCQGSQKNVGFGPLKM